jgi:ribulose-5-phosphate 4-epimerase/fuculose-1-phosphate aldolase
MTFSEVCKKIADLKLVRASNGNYSQRSHLNADEFVISASDVWLEEIREVDIIRCSFKNKKPYPNQLEPSSELLLHLQVYAKRPDVFCILNYQPIYGTLIACQKKVNNWNGIPEIPYYIKGISGIPYYKPGSKELAEAVAEKIVNFDILLMKNRGLVAVGRSQEDLLKKIIFFEFACELLIKSTCDLDRIKI